MAMKLNIPSTIDHAFLPRRKTVFYLPKIGKSINHLSLKEIEVGILKAQSLEEIQTLFPEFINHCNAYQDILSCIKQEYSFVIRGLCNMQKEKEFLMNKIQNLECQNGHSGMLLKLREQKEIHLSKKHMLQNEISDCTAEVKKLEKKLIIYIGKLYKETLNNTTDERQAMLLSFKGRIGFIKDWLLAHGSSLSEFLDLYHDIDQNPGVYKELLSSDEDYIIEKYDSPEVRKAKTDIADQTRKSESHKREIEKIKSNITRFMSLISTQDEKLEEIQLLIKKIKKIY
jgi:hypothetical protein